MRKMIPYGDSDFAIRRGCDAGDGASEEGEIEMEVDGIEYQEGRVDAAQGLKEFLAEEIVVHRVKKKRKCSECGEPFATDTGLCLACINKNLFQGRSGQFTKADGSVVETAKEMITKHHPDLRNARIGFLFRDEPARSQGQFVYAKAMKVSDREKVLVNLDFVIWVAASGWMMQETAWRQALIDHELCHCRYDDAEDKASLVGHDFEEFGAIIERHGFWNYGLLRFKDQVRQLKMDLGAVEEKPARGEVVAVDPEVMGR